MLSISEIVAKTEKMFDLFNDQFYAGELARPAITVSPDGGRGAYGWCSVPRNQYLRRVHQPAHRGGGRDHAP